MIKSMTGFGRYEIEEGQRKISVEMKSVNHRYLETGIRMPKKLNLFEARIRDVLKKYVQRGKLDVFISYEDFSESKVSLKYNPELAMDYYVITGRKIQSPYFEMFVQITGVIGEDIEMNKVERFVCIHKKILYYF